MSSWVCEWPTHRHTATAHRHQPSTINHQPSTIRTAPIRAKNTSTGTPENHWYHYEQENEDTQSETAESQPKAALVVWATATTTNRDAVSCSHCSVLCRYLFKSLSFTTAATTPKARTRSPTTTIWATTKCCRSYHCKWRLTLVHLVFHQSAAGAGAATTKTEIAIKYSSYIWHAKTK